MKDKDKVFHKSKLGDRHRSLIALLMREQPGETPEIVLQATITAIEEVEDSSLRADLLAIVSILAEKRYTAALVRMFIRREMLMESELLKEWTAEERKVATYSTLQTNINDLLEVKFSIVPKHIRGKLQKIQDAEVLRSLSKIIIKVDTLEEYEQYLDKAL